MWLIFLLQIVLSEQEKRHNFASVHFIYWKWRWNFRYFKNPIWELTLREEEVKHTHRLYHRVHLYEHRNQSWETKQRNYNTELLKTTRQDFRQSKQGFVTSCKLLYTNSVDKCQYSTSARGRMVQEQDHQNAL